VYRLRALVLHSTPRLQQEMPPIPRIGEIWTNQSVGAYQARGTLYSQREVSSVEGIAVKVVGTLVTFVSFTGVRIVLQSARQYTTWEWVPKHPTPSIHVPCSRWNCTEQAVVHYTRPRSPQIEVACPRHVPRNIQSQALVLSPTLLTEPGFVAGSVCALCESQFDVIEVIGETTQKHTTVWFCHACNNWWVQATRSQRDITQHGHLTLGLRAVPQGYSFKGSSGVLQLAESTSERERTVTFRIPVVPTQAPQGPKAMTLYDYLLEGNEADQR
jgi:hypothetical protein